MRGALFRRTLPSDQGCVLRPSFSIHTMFMQFPIDVVFLDQDLKVLKISDNVRPFHTASCRGAREVVELRAGECERRGLAVGDRVAWASHQVTTPGAPGADGRSLPHPLLGPVVVASRDARFVKLARFLLDARRVDCPGGIQPDALLRTLEADDAPAAVVLDVGAEHRRGPRGRERGAGPQPRRSRSSSPAKRTSPPARRSELRIYDKWAETGDARRRRRRGGRRPGGARR